jgi:acyl-coenzyme A thioesterase PaaI-like protein
MHGGVIGLLVEAVAEEAVPGGALTDAVVHFLRPGRVGPVEARAVVLGDRVDGTVLDVEIRDLGADRVMSVATATVVGVS